MEERFSKPVIVKTMTVNKKTDVVYDFFENMKYMEMGGAIRSGSLRKGQYSLAGGHSITILLVNLG